jgi:hypothetical protein
MIKNFLRFIFGYSLFPYLQLSEGEAWLMIAKWWENPNIRDYDGWYRSNGLKNCTGLCHCLVVLYRNDWITEQTLDSMKLKLTHHAPSLPNNAYRWGNDLKAAQSRRQFCLDMAKRCDQ